MYVLILNAVSYIFILFVTVFAVGGKCQIPTVATLHCTLYTRSNNFTKDTYVLGYWGRKVKLKAWIKEEYIKNIHFKMQERYFYHKLALRKTLSAIKILFLRFISLKSGK